jgi:hypothetical protein
MKDKIEQHLPFHTIVENNSSELYIVDYKHINGGGVVISGTAPPVDYVYLTNENNVPVYFDGFKENALEIEIGRYCSQCECVVFPTTCDLGDWILFVETKYVHSIVNAFNQNNNYPTCMIDQIIETVNYFRQRGLVEEGRRVHAIVAFPTLIEDFSETFFTGTPTKEDILIDHKILIRATKSGRIISGKRIKI